MLKLWGRRDGSNVIKVTWCLGELGLDYERIDWGGRFGGNDDPEYRAKNPNGRLPTLEEEDGFTLWESGAIIRYLCAKHSMGDLCPEDLRARAAAEKWMDWSSLNLAPFNPVYYAELVLKPRAERDEARLAAAIERASAMYDILDAHLADNAYLGGDRLTIADFPAGSLTHRWIAVTPDRPSHPHVEAWYERLAARPAFQKHVIEANAPQMNAILAK